MPIIDQNEADQKFNQDLRNQSNNASKDESSSEENEKDK